MKLKNVLKIIGSILLVESAFMLPSLLIAIYTNQYDLFAFFITIIITSLIGLALSKIKTQDNNISIREGLAIVSLSWIIVSVFGALPFYISKSIPSFIDAFFEVVSGFTTTGASILSDVESLPTASLFWRSFTHWIGGMGILVFTVALLPTLKIGGYQIFKAESPGPTVDKIVPKIKDTAKILYSTYFTITIIQVILLMFGKMNLFDALLHTFGTVGTGGFGIKNNSVGYYDSSYIQLVIAVFMFLSGVNFSLYYGIFKGKISEFFKDEEFRLYFFIVFISTLFIMLNLLMTSYQSIFTAFKDSFFQVSSIITTTGYSTVNYDLWPTFSKLILFFLMFIGGSAGSTAGGLKVIRILILIKLIKRNIIKIFHPQAYVSIKNNNKNVSEETLISISTYFALFILVYVIGVLLIALEGLDIVSTLSSVAATLGNIGPALGFAGPASSFANFSNFSKLIFSLLMLLGRLEIFTLFALIIPKNSTRNI